MYNLLVAAESTGGMSAIQSALTTAFTDISTNLQTTITNVAPIALGVVGFGIVITFGVKWFKRITNKA